jgi:predicted small integral membrane protein
MRGTMSLLRTVKAVLVASIALWATLVAYGNIADYGSNWAFVQHVLAMDTVFPDNPLRSRAITDPAVQRIAYASIIATEWLMAAACWYGAWRLFRARRDRASFIAAKVPATLALTVIWLLYFVGFVAIGGEWFSMWQSATWNGQQAAVRFLTCAMLAMIVVLLPEEDA